MQVIPVKHNGRLSYRDKSMAQTKYRVNLQLVVRALSLKTGFPARDVEQVINDYNRLIRDDLTADTTVAIRGFGKFSIHIWKGRHGHMIRSGKPIYVPQRPVPVWRPSILVKKSIRKHFTA